MKKEYVAIVAVVVVVIAIAAAYVVSLPPAPTTTTTTPTTTTTTTPTVTTPTVTTPKIEKVRIGLVEPMSGWASVFGIEAANGVRIAVQHINDSGGIKSLGGAKIELVEEDAGETVDKTKSAAERMAGVYKVPIVFGAYISKQTLAMCEVLDGKAIVMIDGLSDYITEQGFTTVFRATSPASYFGRGAVAGVLDWAEKKGVEIKTAAVLNEDSVFGRYVRIGMLEELMRRGVSVVYEKEYYYLITDVSSIMTELQSAKPDAVFHCPYFNDALLFARAVHELGSPAKIWAGGGACGWVDSPSIREGGAAVEYFTNSYVYNPRKNTTWNQKFVADFRALTGEDPADAAGEAYFSIWVIKEVLEEAGKRYPQDPLNVNHLVEILHTIEITSGPAIETYPGKVIAFDEKGDTKYPGIHVMQVQNGKSVTVWPFDVADGDMIIPRPDFSG
jgi:branched-chain amino acid transport system substrate-binding protein